MQFQANRAPLSVPQVGKWNHPAATQPTPQGFRELGYLGPGSVVACFKTAHQTGRKWACLWVELAPVRGNRSCPEAAMLAPQLPRCATLDRAFNLSVPQVLYQ